jgi:predicted nucleic acid-binding protein
VVVVDSSVWIDFLNGVTNPETQWLDLNLDRERIGLTTLILTEVLQGLRTEREAVAVRTELVKYEIIEAVEVGVVFDAAAHHWQLWARGHTVRKMVDLLIATQCIRGGHSWLHPDADFDVFEKYLGRRVVHP